MFLISLSAGIVGGAGLYTFRYAKGLAYLSNDPKACMNCHVMTEHYESWAKASHRAVASCNDCHVPHALPQKYIAKARNGWNHSRAFTMQDFPEPIRITRANLEDLQNNCLECHGDMAGDIASHKGLEPATQRCTQCHRSVGHMSLD